LGNDRNPIGKAEHAALKFNLRGARSTGKIFFRVDRPTSAAQFGAFWKNAPLIPIAPIVKQPAAAQFFSIRAGRKLFGECAKT